MLKTTAVLHEVPLRQFMLEFAKRLPNLIKALKSPEIRNHSRWGKLLPYDVPIYGDGTSPGHCVRPDVVMTEQGPIICEIDYVASGRAHLIESLRNAPSARSQVLQGFANWYRAMDATTVLYGTGTRTSCFRETEIFSQALRSEAGVDITPVNLDEVSDLSGAFVDRLTYASEMETTELDHKYLRRARVSTAEPFLDCKSFAVMIHDPTMTDILVRKLGQDGLRFWQRVVPLTFFQHELDEQAMQIVCANPQRWVIKSSDVETDSCWGCRGTIVGSAYRAQDLVKYLRSGKRLGTKDPGQKPIIQMLGQSIDYTELWNRAVRDPATMADPAVFGRSVSEECQQDAKRPVHARIGFFLPIDSDGRPYTEVAEYAELVLRQSPIVHGASDAIAIAARLV